MLTPPSGAADAACLPVPGPDTRAHTVDVSTTTAASRSQPPTLHRTGTLSSLPPLVITGILVSIPGRLPVNMPSILRSPAGPNVGEAARPPAPTHPGGYGIGPILWATGGSAVPGDGAPVRTGDPLPLQPTEPGGEE